MSFSLFSHAEEPDSVPADGASRAAVAEVVASCRVPRDQHEAFNGFTDYLHLWWPEDLTEFGEGTHPEFEGGVLTETGPDGETAVWATVRTKEPDNSLEMDWVAGHSPRIPTDVRVEFTPDADGSTKVTVRHGGLERLPEPAEEYERINGEWEEILDRYARFMGAR
ncbi:SRPBCC domain-containing protein [Arthrobacter sp. zg-Y40]|uniref:SRPBCC domain-containing protein n=1 Tax=Arthrobacter sp. zg-Y40 TaxID=2886939 RepID=UPI001D13B599|nr:SRPBCC domain-containing protein [Arthrobacter sp. zg-Y40]MCC3280698.1 SRPBCC domain-containing protein [Arthrobacter sp. zg-Y40]